MYTYKLCIGFVLEYWFSFKISVYFPGDKIKIINSMGYDLLFSKCIPLLGTTVFDFSNCVFYCVRYSFVKDTKQVYYYG